MLRPGEQFSPQVRDNAYLAVPYTRGDGIELAAGPEKMFPHWIAVRRKDDDTMGEVEADKVVDAFADTVDTFKKGRLDFVVLRFPIKETLNVSKLLPLLKDGGHLVMIADNGLKVQRLAGGKLEDVQVLPPEGAKTALVCRLGAIGDTFQAASILPELKRQGYHVTVMCHTSGATLLKTDPHVDALWPQDKSQVPNMDLGIYWASVSKHYDRFINLCETVEGTLLSIPGRATYAFPDSVRRELCDHSYLEFTAKVAQLPFHPAHFFYSTDEEKAAAKKRIERDARVLNQGPLGTKSVRPFVIVWALGGSSIHKFYPHQDAVIARILLEIPEAIIYLTGDEACKILEHGWEKEPRVVCTSGEMEIRETLALAQQADLVIGPETGILNAMAFETMPKVIFLSHSSKRNLTGHWVATQALTPVDTPCYPCHRLHYTSEHCHLDEKTGGAMCAINITPAMCWDAVEAAHRSRTLVNSILEAR